VLFGSALESPDTARDLDLACDIPGMQIFAFAGRLEDEPGLSVEVIPLTPASAFTRRRLNLRSRYYYGEVRLEGNRTRR